MKTTQLDFWFFAKAMITGGFIAVLASNLSFPQMIVGSISYVALVAAYKILVINKRK